MKKITILLMGIILSFSLTAQDIDEILQPYYEVMGFDQLSKIKTMVMTGKSSNQGMENEFTMTMYRPGKYRLEVPIQGQKMIQVYNDGDAWYIAPWLGSLDPQDIAGDQLKRMEKQSEFESQLYNYKDKGRTVELLGKEDMEGSDVFKIKLIDEYKDETFYYIDTENFVVLKEETNTIIRGEDTKSETYYSNYKPYGDGDMIMPYSFEVRMKGVVVSTILVKDVKLDIEVDTLIFERPPPAAVEQPAEK